MIKFNCLQMEQTAAVLKRAASKLRAYAENLDLLSNGLEQDGRGYARISIEALNDAAYRADNLADKLAFAADIYRKADKRSVETAENLRAAIPGPNGLSAGVWRPFDGHYAVSQTIPADLFVEDWLMNLMYTDPAV